MFYKGKLFIWINVQSSEHLIIFPFCKSTLTDVSLLFLVRDKKYKIFGFYKKPLQPCSFFTKDKEILDFYQTFSTCCF